jgi:ribosomal protein S18 acetylase RimI-like enzyme
MWLMSIKEAPKMTNIMQVTGENVDLEIDSITEFYNRNFPNSIHERRYKRFLYIKSQFKAIIIIIKENEKIIALLESWISPKRPDVRMLTTLLVDEKFRNRGLARLIMEKLFTLTESEKGEYAWSLNFRESKKEQLIPFYKSFGFEQPKLVGKYANGENMWEMFKR